MLARKFITIDEQNLRVRPIPLSDFPLELKPYAINFCYKPNEYAFHGAFLAEVIHEDELVKQLYCFLETLTPKNENIPMPLKQRIECKDILHPNSIPGIELCFDDKQKKWDIPEKVSICFYTMNNLECTREEILNPFNYTLIQNDKFLLVIRDATDTIELFIYKKY